MTDMDRAGGEFGRAMAAYDALTMAEKSEINAQAACYCYAKGWIAALSREPREEAMDAIANAHGHGQESAMRDAAAWLTKCGMPNLATALLKEYGYAHPPAPAGGARAEPYVPKCGDVFGWEWETDAEAEAEYVRVAVGGDRWVGVSDGAISHGMRDEPVGKGARYLRPATPAERAAAGLHDAGGVGEAKAAFYEAAVAVCLARVRGDLSKRELRAMDAAYDAMLAAEARRGESGEAGKAMGGTP